MWALTVSWWTFLVDTYLCGLGKHQHGIIVNNAGEVSERARIVAAAAAGRCAAPPRADPGAAAAARMQSSWQERKGGHASQAGLAPQPVVFRPWAAASTSWCPALALWKSVWFKSFLCT